MPGNKSVVFSQHVQFWSHSFYKDVEQRDIKSDTDDQRHLRTSEQSSA